MGSGEDQVKSIKLKVKSNVLETQSEGEMKNEIFKKRIDYY
jgi:hypothetical protein